MNNREWLKAIKEAHELFQVHRSKGNNGQMFVSHPDHVLAPDMAERMLQSGHVTWKDHPTYKTIEVLTITQAGIVHLHNFKRRTHIRSAQHELNNLTYT